MTAPVAIAVIFVSGVAAIPAFGRWAPQVTEGLAFLLATVVVVIAVMLLCDRWPNLYANPEAPIAMTATPSGDERVPTPPLPGKRGKAS